MLQKKKSEIEFFNQFADNCGYDVFGETGYHRLINEFLKYLSPYKREKGKFKIIDLGCGTGSFTSRLHKYGFDLMALDISPRCISYARENYPDIEFMVGDIEHLDFDNNVFNVVFLSGVLHHFPKLSHVLSECHRVLKKGGILLGYDPNRANPFMWLARAKQSPFYSSKGITENERLLSAREINEALVSGGFSEKKVYGISGIIYKYIDNKFSFLILPIYNFIEKIMDLTALRYKFGSMLITYAKK